MYQKLDVNKRRVSNNVSGLSIFFCGGDLFRPLYRNLTPLVPLGRYKTYDPTKLIQKINASEPILALL
jgi:hypothetical protein